jgi:hypothetical protein
VDARRDSVAALRGGASEPVFVIFFFSLAVGVVIGVEIIWARPDRRRLLADLVGTGTAIGDLLAPFAGMSLRVRSTEVFAIEKQVPKLHLVENVEFLTMPSWSAGCPRAGFPGRCTGSWAGCRSIET